VHGRRSVPRARPRGDQLWNAPWLQDAERWKALEVVIREPDGAQRERRSDQILPVAAGSPPAPRADRRDLSRSRRSAAKAIIAALSPA
jgi:hypothetical protein